MRVKDDCFQKEEKQVIKSELLDLLNQPSDKQERPCPGCRLTFPNDASVTSTANCSYRCPHAPQKMSSDPDRYPIEPNVVPIVYALYTMRLMMPCWSCEGHADQQGSIVKLPKIWFYSISAFYPKIVAQMLSDLQGKHILRNPWTVKILPFSQSMLTITYSIEPNVDDIKALNLEILHRDILDIAKHFRADVTKVTSNYLQKIDKSAFK